MTEPKNKLELHLRPTTFGETLESAIAKMREYGTGAVGRGLLATSLFVAPALNGCAMDPGMTVEDDPSFFGGKGDWARENGSRNSSIVNYVGDYWHEYRDCYSRGGCQGVEVFLKLRVSPQTSVETQRVGVVYTLPDGTEGTSVAYYNHTYGDGSGDMEYIAPVRINAWGQRYFRFTAWYQAEAYGRTVFDDNEGDTHVVAIDSNAVIYLSNAYRNPGGLYLDDTGVHGTMELFVADLDYEKDIQLVYTLDDWNTYETLGMASGEELASGNPIQNRWYWVADRWGTDEFHMDVQLDATGADRMQFAIVYRHGLAQGARRYDFWLNNYGSNYTVSRGPSVRDLLED